MPSARRCARPSPRRPRSTARSPVTPSASGTHRRSRGRRSGAAPRTRSPGATEPPPARTTAPPGSADGTPTPSSATRGGAAGRPVEPSAMRAGRHPTAENPVQDRPGRPPVIRSASTTANARGVGQLESTRSVVGPAHRVRGGAEIVQHRSSTLIVKRFISTTIPRCRRSASRRKHPPRDVHMQAGPDRQRPLVDDEPRVVVRELTARTDERVAAGASPRYAEKSSPPMIGSRSDELVAHHRAHQRRRRRVVDDGLVAEHEIHREGCAVRRAHALPDLLDQRRIRSRTAARTTATCPGAPPRPGSRSARHRRGAADRHHRRLAADRSAARQEVCS